MGLRICQEVFEKICNFSLKNCSDSFCSPIGAIGFCTAELLPSWHSHYSTLCWVCQEVFSTFFIPLGDDSAGISWKDEPVSTQSSMGAISFPLRWLLTASLLTSLLYHTLWGLSRGFSKVFWNFFLTTRLGDSLTLHTYYSTFSKPCQYFFQSFWKIFWKNLPPSAYPFSVLQLVSVGFGWGVTPLDIIIVPHFVEFVKRFSTRSLVFFVRSA